MIKTQWSAVDESPWDNDDSTYLSDFEWDTVERKDGAIVKTKMEQGEPDENGYCYYSLTQVSDPDPYAGNPWTSEDVEESYVYNPDAPCENGPIYPPHVKPSLWTKIKSIIRRITHEF